MKNLDLLLLSAKSKMMPLLSDVMSVLEEGASLEDSSLAPLNDTVNDIGGGGINLLRKGLTFLAVAALMIAGGKLVFSDSTNRSFIKNDIVAKIIGIILIFAAVTLVVLFEKLGKGLFQ